MHYISRTGSLEIGHDFIDGGDDIDDDEEYNYEESLNATEVGFKDVINHDKLSQSLNDAKIDADSEQKVFSQLYTEEEMQVQLNKVNVLSNENKRLKTKQTKLKTAYDSLNQKHNTLLESVKTTEDKLMHQTEACLALRHELDEIRRNQDKVDKSVVTGIMARIKVAGTGYTLLVKESGKTEWHSDHQIVKI